MEYKIVFVILHYNNLKDTINCIDSIAKYCNNKNVEVVVVDNGSKIESIIEIKENYDKDSFMHFILLEDNLGFAKGNNVGFQFAKHQLNANIIILSNNDIIYYQEDFIELLIKNYEEVGFDIAGPKIVRVEDQLVQNPTPILYRNKIDVLRRLIKFFILFLSTFLGLDLFLRNRFGNNIDTEIYKVNDFEDFQLHGACLIFGEKYIQKYEGLYDKTFMYGEESILKYISDRDGLKMKYFDNLELSHYEGATVSTVYGKGVTKRRFFYKWNFIGCLELYKLMSKGSLEK
ncbi:glycosyltransferase [Streptococcus suis]|uniref:Glycosyltransferase n=1 Tax=Streptococcus suis TaxID=1307 RepID=A0A9X4ML97_STRSU|nr:glycosyltransferase [Streptococcus suis]QCO71513.1 Glycosyltransferase [Streptococcus suis]